MSRETKNKTIGDHTYICTQFPPKKALKILTKLTKYLGAPLAEIMKSTDPEKGILDQDISKLNIGEAIQALGGSLGDDDLYELCTEVCESVVLNMKAGEQGLSGQLKDNVFDEHFMGGKGLKRLFPVVTFALEVNYGDFLGDAVAEAAKVAAASQAPE